MKNSKKMVLLRFLHAQLLRENYDAVFSYAQLYASIPVAQSTIRGIVNEFEQLGYVRVSNQQQIGWGLTQRGLSAACEQFTWYRERVQESNATLVIIGDAGVRRSAPSTWLQIDAHTFLCFDKPTHSSLRKMTASVLLDARQKGITDLIFQTPTGKAAWKKRLRLELLLRQLQSKESSSSQTSQTLRRYRLATLTEIISATSVGPAIPEEYYPSNMRLRNFLLRVW